MKIELSVGDVIETKKPHPCGSPRWRVLRTGMDIKIKCLGCGRIIMMPYEDFVRRFRRKCSD